MNKTHRPLLSLAPVVPALLAAAFATALASGCSGSAETGNRPELYTVTKGDLRITVTEAATLAAARSVDIKSEIEGNHTVIYLAPEGSRVETGKKLVELDCSDLLEKSNSQEINYLKAKAAWEQAEENYKIVQKQNESDINAGSLKVRYAELDLEKFRGKLLDDDPAASRPAESQPAGEGKRDLGKRELDLEDARSKIKIAQEELKRAQDRYDWSVKLEKKGFITRTELEADGFSVTKCQTALTLAENNLKLLVQYDQRKEEIQRVADVEESQAELERVKSRCHAKLLQEDADRKSKKATFELEREKFEKIKDQISKATIYAPKPGLVVYATFGDGGRRGRPQLIEEGMQVRERQTMIILPDVSSMLALTSIHESQIEKIKEGQFAIAKVEGATDAVFSGRVTKVALLPDSSQSFMSPEIKVYRTEVVLDGDTSALRPGMSASLEILVSDLHDVVFVPVHAVCRAGKANYVWVEGTPQPIARRITVGLHNDKFIHVADGLQTGEVVLLAPPKDVPTPTFPAEKDADAAEKALARRGTPGTGPDAGRPTDPQTTDDGGSPRRGRSGNRGSNPAMAAFVEKVKAKFPDLNIADGRDLRREDVRAAIQGDPELQAEQTRLMAGMGGPNGRRRGGENGPGANGAKNPGTGGGAVGDAAAERTGDKPDKPAEENGRQK